MRVASSGVSRSISVRSHGSCRPVLGVLLQCALDDAGVFAFGLPLPALTVLGDVRDEVGFQLAERVQRAAMALLLESDERPCGVQHGVVPAALGRRVLQRPPQERVDGLAHARVIAQVRPDGRTGRTGTLLPFGFAQGPNPRLRQRRQLTWCGYAVGWLAVGRVPCVEFAAGVHAGPDDAIPVMVLDDVDALGRPAVELDSFGHSVEPVPVRAVPAVRARTPRGRQHAQPLFEFGELQGAVRLPLVALGRVHVKADHASGHDDGRVAVRVGLRPFPDLPVGDGLLAASCHALGRE